MALSAYSFPGLKKHTPYDARVIMNLVMEYFNVKEKSISGNSRQIKICIPRQVAMFIIKRKTNLSLKEVGELFNRDHSTVIHSISVINNYYYTNNEPIIKAISTIEERLKIN